MGDRILEVGGAGIEGADAKVKALMNNIVNSETPGYRKSDVIVRSFPTYLDEAQNKSSTQVPQVEGVYYNQTPGTLLRTGNRTDIALGGPGFFVIRTPKGECYTRDGRFTVDANGRLVTIAGNYPVVGLEGDIAVTPGDEMEFEGDGKIRVKGVNMNTIKVVNIKDSTALKSVTGSIFQYTGQSQIEVIDTPRIVSGYIEASNSNVIEETMNLIYLNRMYGINTKIVSNRDAMISRALEMGRSAQ